MIAGWVAAIAVMAVAVIAVIYRGATTPAGFCFRILQVIYLSFWSLETYRRRGSNGLSLVELVVSQKRSRFEDVAYLLVPSLGGWFSRSFPTDKGNWHDYLRVYDALFKPYRNLEEVRILEVGVKKGGSIALWREFFASDAFVYGIDVYPDVPTFSRDGHIKILVLDARDREAVNAALQDISFDIILDDGLHDPDLQWITFQNLLPHLKTEGLYILEDVFSIEEARYENMGCSSTVVPDSTGQYLQVLRPPASRARDVDLTRFQA